MIPFFRALLVAALLLLGASALSPVSADAVSLRVAFSGRIATDAAGEILLGAEHEVRVEGGGGLVVEVRLGGGAWHPYAGPFQLPPVTGLHVVEARALDGEGAVVASAERTLHVDVTPPVITLDAPSVGVVYSDFPLVASYPSTAAAERGVAVFYWSGPLRGAAVDEDVGLFRTEASTNGGGAWFLLDPLFRVSHAWAEDGRHEVHVRAVDRLGNAAEVAVPVEYHESLPPTDAPSGAPDVRPGEMLFG